MAKQIRNMKIVVLSDTHIPRTAQDLPLQVYDEINSADMILHAGDFSEKELLDKLKVFKETKAVYGNMDSAQLRHILHPKEVISIGRFKIGLIHGYGPPRDLMETVGNEFEDVDVVVFGHSHSPLNVLKDGVLFFNPGSPTDKIFASSNSYGILEISDNEIKGRIVIL